MCSRQRARAQLGRNYAVMNTLTYPMRMHGAFLCSGVVVTLVSPSERFVVDKMAERLGVPILVSPWAAVTHRVVVLLHSTAAPHSTADHMHAHAFYIGLA